MLINFRHENKIDESLFCFKNAIQIKPTQTRINLFCMYLVIASILLFLIYGMYLCKLILK